MALSREFYIPKGATKIAAKRFACSVLRTTKKKIQPTKLLHVFYRQAKRTDLALWFQKSRCVTKAYRQTDRKRQVITGAKSQRESRTIKTAQLKGW